MIDRLKISAALLSVIAAPALAQTPANDPIARIEAELSAYEAHVRALEAEPPAPGSERALRAEIEQLADRLADLSQRRATAREAIERQQAALAEAVQTQTEGWEESALAPSPEVIIEPINPVPDQQDFALNSSIEDGSDTANIVQAEEPEQDAETAAQIEQPISESASSTETAGSASQIERVTPQDEPEADGAITVTEAVTAELPEIAADTPMQVNGLSRRVLTLPNAQLVEPGASSDGSAEPLPTFTVLYVFDELEMDGSTWLAVGEDPIGARGWIGAHAVEDWKSMLVMRFANVGDRSRALFFGTRDQLEDLAYDAEFNPARVDTAYARAELGQSTEGIISIEPATSVNVDDRPYFMPITAFERFYFEESGLDALMLELASINANSSQDRATAQNAAINQGDIITAREVVDTSALEDFRIGVAFVIDTTRSMGPYIERAQDFVLSIEDQLAGMRLSDQFDFSLVGFRDNTDVVEGVGYVTNVYRDFDTPGDTAALRDAVMQMQPAGASTQNWREDAFAGLEDAILRLSWNEVDTRIVFLITDASPRSLGDDLARSRWLGPASVLAMAEQNNITLMVMHMQTEDARRISMQTEGYDDHQLGQSLYRRLQGTGIGTLATYFQVRGDSAAAFERTLNQISSEVAEALGSLANGQAIAQPKMEDPFVAALMANPSGVTIDETAGERQVAATLVSELFRYQQEFLGENAGVEAPDFYRAWTMDRDLRNPDVRMLDVYSFMTRENLGDLYAELSAIVEALDTQEQGVGDFFENARIQSGQATVDPAISTLLPEYIQGLPYRSFFMNINRAQWDALPFQQKEEILDSVRDKLNAYRLIFQTEAGWLRLSERVGSEEVYPLPLDLLP